VNRHCRETNKLGEPCGAKPLRNGDLCFAHDPAHAEDAAEARKLGGLRRGHEGTVTTAYELGDIGSIEGLRRLFEIIVADGLGLDAGATRERVLIAALNAGMKLHELADIDVRLSRLEAAERQRRQTRAAAEPASLLDEDAP
jgi:hypothetical protein